MMGWGRRFRVSLFGTSHGPEVGVTIDGIPKGTPVDVDRIQAELDRRRPVGRRLASRRQEPDRLRIDSGLSHGRADGSLFRAHVRNEDVRRAPYERLRSTPRPGHADYPARVRFGDQADLSGGGIFSGRMTVGLVIAGTIARRLWEEKGVAFVAFTRSIGKVQAKVGRSLSVNEIRRAAGENEPGTPDPEAARRMVQAIEGARREGDSLGGVVEARVTGLPVGVGEPFFGSIESVVADLAFSIPGVKAVEFGAGFGAARMRGSEHNDPFVWDGRRVVTASNHAGGVLGGLAVGTPVVFRVAIKPTSSIAREQTTINLDTHRPERLRVTGRHDPCIVPRAVPVIEAVAAIALTDLGLLGGFLP